MYPTYLRDKARQLRTQKKLTIDELAERLALPRSTLYNWVRDLPIPRTNRQTRAQRIGTRAMQAKYRRLRESAYLEGRGTFAALSADPTFRDFVCLYVAEGHKRDRNCVSIANSDPRIMKLAARWMKQFAPRLVLSLQYHDDQDPEGLKTYWAKALGLEASRFRYMRKSNSGQSRDETGAAGTESSRSRPRTHCFELGCKDGSIPSTTTG